MESICKNCNRQYYLYSINAKMDNVVTNYDKYCSLVIIDKQKYLEYRCKCGTMVFEKVEQ